VIGEAGEFIRSDALEKRQLFVAVSSQTHQIKSAEKIACCSKIRPKNK
jgi:hypothetical protein